MSLSNNSGSIRVNKNKTEHNQPDYKGKIVIEGVEYWVSGWKKERDGDTWLSMAFDKVQQPNLDL